MVLGITTAVAVSSLVPRVTVLAVTTVALDVFVTDASINFQSIHFTPSAMAGFSFSKTDLISLDNLPAS